MVRAPAVAVLVAFLLLLPLASAQDFSFSVREIKTSILPDEQVMIDLGVINLQNRPDTFRISAPDVLWNVQSDPLYYYFGGVDIEPGKNETVRLLFNPTARLPAGPYRIELSVTSKNTGRRDDVAIFVRVKSAEPQLRDYLAAVAKIVDMPSNIDPRDEFVITVTLANRNPKNISELHVILSSKLINEKRITSLEPLGKKTVDIRVKLDSLTPPQDDVMKTTLIADGDTLTPVLQDSFRISSYSDVIEQRQPSEKGFLKRVESTTYTNDGNIDTVKLVERETGFFSKLFTSASREGFTVNRDGRKFLAWELRLQPQQSVTITVEQNYQPVFVLLAIAAAAALAYFFFRSPVTMRKEATVLSFREGGISEVKVLLHVRNRSGNQFERLTITDHLPYITDVEHDIDVGTLKPTKVQHSGNTTSIRWDIELLERNEERILSYRMRSKLSILGGFVLPRATLSFFDRKGNKFATRSQQVTVRD